MNSKCSSEVAGSAGGLTRDCQRRPRRAIRPPMRLSAGQVATGRRPHPDAVFSHSLVASHGPSERVAGLGPPTVVRRRKSISVSHSRYASVATEPTVVPRGPSGRGRRPTGGSSREANRPRRPAIDSWRRSRRRSTTSGSVASSCRKLVQEANDAVAVDELHVVFFGPFLGGLGERTRRDDGGPVRLRVLNLHRVVLLDVLPTDLVTLGVALHLNGERLIDIPSDFRATTVTPVSFEACDISVFQPRSSQRSRRSSRTRKI